MDNIAVRSASRTCPAILIALSDLSMIRKLNDMQAQALATRKKAEKELAAAAAAKAIAEAEATAAAGPAALQGASKKKPVVAKNIMLKGARMAFHGTGQASKVPLNKV